MISFMIDIKAMTDSIANILATYFILEIKKCSPSDKLVKKK